MFENLIVQPLVNALVFIYALIPGHNFGLALILFTILIRLAIHPLIRKQLHHGRAMKALQPEIEKIKKATKGDSAETSRLTMELYKERGISPFSSLGPLLVQIFVLLGLFTGLRHIADDPNIIVTNAYSWLRDFGFMKEIAADISKFDFTLFGWVDLSRAAGGEGSLYVPALVLVIGATVSQYFMGKQTLPEDKDARSLRDILKREKKEGANPSAQGLAGQSLKYLIPIFILWFTYYTASALALYWFVGGVVGYIQQRRILQEDEDEMLHMPTPAKKTAPKKTAAKTTSRKVSKKPVKKTE